MRETLIFTVATNGYAALFRKNLQTQRDYARRYGYDYRAFTDVGPASALESAWMKIALTLQALKSGYREVMFVDADCRITDVAPSISTVSAPGKYLYMGTGQTNRLNSGVIIARHHPETITLIERILARREEPIPLECHAPYENGHVIYHATGSAIVSVLDRRWNDHSVHDGNEYIRHGGGVGRRRWGRVVRRVLQAFHPRDGHLAQAGALSIEERAALVWRIGARTD